MPCGELFLVHQCLHVGRQLEEPQEVGDGGAVPAHGGPDLRVPEVEFLAEAVVSGGLVDGREVAS
jgi:hypothetical protein